VRLGDRASSRVGRNNAAPVGATLTVELRNAAHLQSSDTSGSSAATATAAHPANPAHGSAEGTAANALKEISGADYPQVKSSLENRWVPQVSSKKVGLFVDGITYNSVDILRNHLTLRQQHDDVRLVSSANRWCDAHGIDAFNCFAKMIGARLGPDGTTVLRK
jgi:hypothetical protein